MKEAYWGYWLILLGIFVMGIMMMTQNLTTSNTQDYYQLKEIAESSMLDSIDYGYYRVYGKIKMNREEFVETFLKRFAQNASLGSTYKVDFYGLYESPPKVSIKVSSTSSSFTLAEESLDFEVVNKLDAIIVKDNNISTGDVCCVYHEECIF